MTTLEEQLETVTVFEPGTWEAGAEVSAWHAVADGTGIIAYFAKEEHAFNFRLALINARLNPL